jgi:hypothetical protein
MIRHSRAPDPSPLKKSSRGSRATPTSIWESSTTLSGGLGPIPHNAPSSLRSKGGPCPLGPYKTSSGQRNVSTQNSYESLSTAWSLPLRGGVTSTTCNTFCLRSNGQSNYEWGLQQEHPLSCNSPFLPHQADMLRTGDRWPSNSPAAMGTNAQPDGSSAWTKDGWPGTPRGTPLATSQSLLTSMPQSTPGGKMTCLGGS